ncbi:MAG: ThiF family adenylyltransferase [Planctomycetes bacterium]|nr:ThiF family adenylyltransferase [Planctomycetota bacterium]
MERFDYDQAFERNLGVLRPEQQARLQRSSVAIAGMGGVGGIYAQAFARMGVGGFRIADGDTFELVNFNHQVGGTMQSIGRNKALTMQEHIRAINPQARISAWDRHLDEDNIVAFLDGADLVIDAIEIFAVDAHRMLFREARRRNQTVIMAAPLGFSAAVVVFAPGGPEPERYFGWKDGQCEVEQVARFAMGLAPAHMHRNQCDLRTIDIEARVGPSNFSACLLCAGIVAMEGARRLLDLPGQWSAPQYLQLDLFTLRLKQGRLPRGCNGLLQRVKRWLLIRQYRRLQAERQARPGSSANRPAPVFAPAEAAE